jgi:D-alanine--poly(phosphoribitol) ligase subunit 1
MAQPARHYERAGKFSLRRSKDGSHSRVGKLQLNFNLALSVYRQSLDTPDRPALVADERTISYGELAQLARNIAGVLRSAGARRGAYVAVLASRSVAGYAGLLGTCWIGASYMPISLAVPEKWLVDILEIAKPAAIIADDTGAQLLSERVLEVGPALVLVPDRSNARKLRTRQNQHVYSLSALEFVAASDEPALVREDEIAYVMFTSGSTGAPKGVMVTVGAVHHYLLFVRGRYPLFPDDRVAAHTDLSFDLSVHDMFLAWSVGTSLHVVPAAQTMVPARFIKERAITAWFSVPSIIGMMKRVKALRRGSFPSLRYSLFCGEPLPLSAAHAWQEAAPNSTLDNLYGPTEATVACLLQPVGASPVVTGEREIISIGCPIGGMEAAIVSPTSAGVFLSPGERGELALAGPQLATGYFRAPELTAKRFPLIAGKRWYLTGDLAYQDAEGRFHHLGRIDNQVKINGYRIELEEVEAHLRTICGTDLVAAVAWPVAHGSASGIVGFYVGKELTSGVLRDALARRIPLYMVPNRILAIDSLPLNSNGKVDRKSLVAQLDRKS